LQLLGVIPELLRVQLLPSPATAWCVVVAGVARLQLLGVIPELLRVQLLPSPATAWCVVVAGVARLQLLGGAIPELLRVQLLPSPATTESSYCLVCGRSWSRKTSVAWWCDP
ncbi:MAG: hypothetical protein NTV29_13910, partial [Planctomycetota bacterium]|nr:hypothetical protein [Planctomycetota bacterium]